MRTSAQADVLSDVAPVVPEIIRAVTSPLGLVTLAFIILGTVALIWFSRESVLVRLGVYFISMGLVGWLVARVVSAPSVHRGLVSLAATSSTPISASSEPLFMSVSGGLSRSVRSMSSPIEAGRYGKLRCQADDLSASAVVVVALAAGECGEELVFGERNPAVQLNLGGRVEVDSIRSVDVPENGCVAYRIVGSGDDGTFLHCSFVRVE